MSYQGTLALSSCLPENSITIEPKDCDYILYTDGSGNDSEKELLGGWSAVVIKNKPCDDGMSYDCCIGTQNNTSIGASELSGIIAGLQTLMVKHKFYGKSPEKCYPLMKKLKVFIFCDREDVVLSITGKYSRSEAYVDRWAAFGALEAYFDIYITHVKRNTIGLQSLADVHASTIRSLLKEHIVLQKDAGLI